MRNMKIAWVGVTVVLTVLAIAWSVYVGLSLYLSDNATYASIVYWLAFTIIGNLIPGSWLFVTINDGMFDDEVED